MRGPLFVVVVISVVAAALAGEHGPVAAGGWPWLSSKSCSLKDHKWIPVQPGASPCYKHPSTGTKSWVRRAGLPISALNGLTCPEFCAQDPNAFAAGTNDANNKCFCYSPDVATNSMYAGATKYPADSPKYTTFCQGSELPGNEDTSGVQVWYRSDSYVWADTNPSASVPAYIDPSTGTQSWVRRVGFTAAFIASTGKSCQEFCEQDPGMFSWGEYVATPSHGSKCWCFTDDVTHSLYDSANHRYGGDPAEATVFVANQQSGNFRSAYKAYGWIKSNIDEVPGDASGNYVRRAGFSNAQWASSRTCYDHCRQDANLIAWATWYTSSNTCWCFTRDLNHVLYSSAAYTNNAKPWFTGYTGMNGQTSGFRTYRRCFDEDETVPVTGDACKAPFGWQSKPRGMTPISSTNTYVKRAKFALHQYNGYTCEDWCRKDPNVFAYVVGATTTPGGDCWCYTTDPSHPIYASASLTYFNDPGDLHHWGERLPEYGGGYDYRYTGAHIRPGWGQAPRDHSPTYDANNHNQILYTRRGAFTEAVVRTKGTCYEWCNQDPNMISFAIWDTQPEDKHRCWCFTTDLSHSIYSQAIYTQNSNPAFVAYSTNVIAAGLTTGVSSYYKCTGDGSVGSTPTPALPTPPPTPNPAHCTGACLLNACSTTGQLIEFTTTGAASNLVWGSGPYTDDSDAAAAAVHGGQAAIGETKALTVRCAGAQSSFTGSEANGVVSQSFAASWPRTFSFDLEGETQAPAPPLPTVCYHEPCVMNTCTVQGATKTITVKGVTGNNVWGTNYYTDDSWVGSAAVHKGLLQPGETGAVTITCTGAQESYTGSESNGVVSQSYGYWQFSYALASGPATPPPAAANQCVGACLQNTCKPGEAHRVRVTGSLVGRGWGTSAYTDDTTVSMASVHAGLLQSGATGEVIATCISDPGSFTGSTQNGVTTSSYGSWPNAFSLSAAQPSPTPTSCPGTCLHNQCTFKGQVHYVEVTGTSSGSLWGTSIYSDDSDVSTAAVHANLATVGQTKTLRAICMGAQDSFEATETNSIASQPYGSWPFSYTLENL